MSYANRKQMSSNRTASIVIVALIHVVLGYALVTGLAYNVVKKAAEDLKTFDVEDEPPPPPEEPPPPPEKMETPPPPQVVAPPPIVRTNVAPPPVVATPVAPPPVITPTAKPAPPAPPAPPQPVKSQAAKAKGSLPGLIDGESDYPSEARRNEEQGTVRVRLDVGTNGRVTGCSVVGSSGSRSLDDATCRILKSRARFTPAQDQNGNPIPDTITAPGIRWQLVD